MRALWALIALACGDAAAAEVPQVEAEAPRAFGYQVGDLVRQRVTLILPAGWQLDPETLPRPGGRGRAVELRAVTRDEFRRGGTTSLRFDLEYQVFLAPAAVRLVEIAPWRLGALGAGRREDLRVEAVPIAIAPLLPEETVTRNGFGDLQPDRAPPLVDTRRWQTRLGIWAALALLPVGALFAVHVGVPWQMLRRRPFAVAWRELRRLPAEPSGAEWRAALRTLHRALDRAAGTVLFEAGIDRFVAAAPRYRELRDDVARFIVLSRREFFGDGAAPAAGDARWLVGLARRLRDAERGGR